MWYTGAYGVRANMQGNNFGSILVDRGDRDAFQGDGHPSMAAAEAAFGGPPVYSLVKSALQITDCHNDNATHHRICRFPNGTVQIACGSYPVYWTMSVFDYFWATGDAQEFRLLLPDVLTILDYQIRQFPACLLSKKGVQPNCVNGMSIKEFGDGFCFIGWDDRAGIGGAEPMAANGEPYRVFNALVVRAIRELVRCLSVFPDMKQEAAKYGATAESLTNGVRAVKLTVGKPWWAPYGVHAAAKAINAGLVTETEIGPLFDAVLNDAVTICSLSPFNTFFTLQGLANAGHYEHALTVVNRCWGPMTTLGKGCFWELFDPEWGPLLDVGQKAPTRPSYCK